MTDWPWSYLYTMATVYLNRSDSEFWEMTPRQLIAMIDQWRKIERSRDITRALIAAGHDPDEAMVDPEEIKRQEYELGAVMW